MRARPTARRLTAPVTAAAALSASSEDLWARWRLDRETRDVQRRVNAELEAREAANLPIYPRECAARIAADARTVPPDWRHIRPTLDAAWGRLLKAQPELSPDLTRQREATITAVFNSVPKPLQTSVSELRTLIDLLLMAHEAAAYHVGCEGGKLESAAQESPRGRTHFSHRAPRTAIAEPLRLSLAEEPRPCCCSSRSIL